MSRARADGRDRDTVAVVRRRGYVSDEKLANMLCATVDTCSDRFPL
jgi:hypothetical protein